MSYTFSKKNFFLLYFGKRNFLASRLKNYIFSQKKVFLIFRVELCSPKIKKLLYFFKIAFLIFWKIELLEKTSYISEGNFPSSKNYKNLLWKSLFYFGKRIFPASRLKNSYIFSKKKKSYISGGNLQSLETNISYISLKNSPRIFGISE